MLCVSNIVRDNKVSNFNFLELFRTIYSKTLRKPLPDITKEFCDFKLLPMFCKSADGIKRAPPAETISNQDLCGRKAWVQGELFTTAGNNHIIF